MARPSRATREGLASGACLPSTGCSRGQEGPPADGRSGRSGPPGWRTPPPRAGPPPGGACIPSFRDGSTGALHTWRRTTGQCAPRQGSTPTPGGLVGCPLTARPPGPAQPARSGGTTAQWRGKPSAMGCVQPSGPHGSTPSGAANTGSDHEPRPACSRHIGGTDPRSPPGPGAHDPTRVGGDSRPRKPPALARADNGKGAVPPCR